MHNSKNPHPFEIGDENTLHQMYSRHCEKNLALISFAPVISRQRILDTYKAWKADLERAKNGSFRDDDVHPDHIKCAAHLAYWLRREAPIVDLNSMGSMYDNNEMLLTELDADEGYTEVPQEELSTLTITIGGDSITLEEYVKSRRLAMAYSNELLAFTFTFTLAKAYEEQKILEKKGENITLNMPSSGYLEDLCYFFKFKSVSPHSIDLIYRALLGRSTI